MDFAASVAWLRHKHSAAATVFDSLSVLIGAVKLEFLVPPYSVCMRLLVPCRQNNQQILPAARDEGFSIGE